MTTININIEPEDGWVLAPDGKTSFCNMSSDARVWIAFTEDETIVPSDNLVGENLAFGIIRNVLASQPTWLKAPAQKGVVVCS